MSLVIRKLVAKELYVNRWVMTGAALSAALSAAIAALGPTGFNLGSLMWITTVVAFGVMLGFNGITRERKEDSLEFVLSLPVSVRGYVFSKLAGLFLSFLLPWAVATLSAVILVKNTEVPNGLLPFVLLLSVFMLSNYAVVLCGALHVRSEGASTVLIILTNMAVTLFMFTVGPMPGIADHMRGGTPVWNETFYAVLATELVVLLAALCLPLLIAARRRDFI